MGPTHKNIRQALITKFGDSLGLADVSLRITFFDIFSAYRGGFAYRRAGGLGRRRFFSVVGCLKEIVQAWRCAAGDNRGFGG